MYFVVVVVVLLTRTKTGKTAKQKEEPCISLLVFFGRLTCFPFWYFMHCHWLLVALSLWLSFHWCWEAASGYLAKSVLCLCPRTLSLSCTDQRWLGTSWLKEKTVFQKLQNLISPLTVPHRNLKKFKYWWEEACPVFQTRRRMERTECFPKESIVLCLKWEEGMN